ncbi:MAG: 4'-phosphopantetheinyl transferase superfamily protein [Actinobacteria bacterium]|nr:4'-phosphopantetheinyl transferase superfamily protein [Actinomycetota bacterium]
MKIARTPPKSDEVHVWRVRVPEKGSRDAARAALDALLADYLPGTAPPELARDRNGKPRLARDRGRLSFNLSHSGGLALIAIASGEVDIGIDVERLRPRRDLVRLAERWLPRSDAEALGTAPESEREAIFYSAWTRHEARVKCVGSGLAGPPPGPTIVAHQLQIDEGYAAAVAFEGKLRIVLRDACARG